MSHSAAVVLAELLPGPLTTAEVVSAAGARREVVREVERGGLIAADGEGRRGAHRRLRLTSAGMRAMGYLAPWERSPMTDRRYSPVDTSICVESPQSGGAAKPGPEGASIGALDCQAAQERPR